MRRGACSELRRTPSVGVMAKVASIAALVVACGTSNSPPCSAGDLLSCTCGSGASGTQACTSNGSYGPCSCAMDAATPEAAAPEAGPGDGGGDLPYMASCLVVGNPGDCARPDECFDFPNRGQYCTHPCTANTDCALPSTGCNGMGVCKAPNATGAGDGGGDGG
jgi:hypothetical protein